jgi:Uma2 family endonuclease
MGSATVARPPGITADKSVVLAKVSWDTYERLLADDEERRIPRMTYDQGVLEFVTPSLPHEKDALTIVRFVDFVGALLGVPILSAGGTTYRRYDLERGFEPDGSFYVQNAALVRDQQEIDLSVDPPPDIVLEMEMSRAAIKKLALFASMGIPEVWCWDGRRVRIYALERDHYRESSSSLALPVLTSDDLTRFLLDSRTMLSPDWFQAVLDWARERTIGSR